MSNDVTLTVGEDGSLSEESRDINDIFDLVTIEKASIKDDLFLHAEYSIPGPDGKRRNIIVKCNSPVHQDMRLAFALLDIHLAIICEQLDPKLVEEVEEPATFKHPALQPFKVTGFSIGGTDEHAGVTLIGRRTLVTGKVLNLIAPFTKFTDTHLPYAWEFELSEAIEVCFDEVKEYILNGKKAPEQQTSFNFPDDLDNIKPGDNSEKLN